MRKIVNFFTIMVLLASCSFDNKSGIWTGSDKVSKKTNESEQKLEFVFKNQNNTIKDKDLSSKKTFQFEPPKKFSKWSQRYQNKSNYLGNVSFFNDGNYKKFSKISSTEINDNILVYKNNLFFSDYKGNIGIFSISQNQLIFKFNFYKNKIKKTKKNIKLILNDNFIIAADNFGYVYSIDYKNNKLIWAKNFLVPFRSNLKIIDSVLFLSDEKNKIVLIDTKSGKLIDELYTQPSKTVSKFESNIAIDNDNNLLYLSTNGTLYSLNLINQKSINWIQNFKTESEIIFNAHPIIIQKNEIIISTDKNISLIGANGARIWDINIKSNVKPIIAGNIIFTINEENYLVFINKDIGQIIYSKNINLLIEKNYNKSFKRKINKIEHILITNNKLLLISKNSYFIEIDLKNSIKINAIKKNPFAISSDIIFLENEMMFVSSSKRFYKVN